LEKHSQTELKVSRNSYSTPVDKDYSKNFTSDSETHVGMDRFAIDFLLPEGNNIYASASGVVIYAKDDSCQGGDDQRFEDFKFYNHIIIKHDNGEYTEYGHLQHRGIKKKVGDHVKEGEFIALSGNTGYSSEPHLHFAVFVLSRARDNFRVLPDKEGFIINNEDLGFRTIEPRFKQT